MQKQLTLLLLFVVGITVSCQTQEKKYNLQDYYNNDPTLARTVDEVYNQLSVEQRVAQMIVISLGKLGKPYAEVEPLIKANQVGGIIFLSGDPEQFKSDIESIQAMSAGFPLLMSMDAEPSLFNRRMPGTPEMKPTSSLKTTDDIKQAVSTIDQTLHHVGFQHNYAPVIDMSPNNEAIGNRSLGSDSATIVPLAISFITETQNDQIIATAKHFPGHGRVSGDTHKKLVYIDGELTEVNLYKPIIEAGVISIMVGHIAIENNQKYSTEGLPSTLSEKVVTDLLRNEMQFDGLIITDAMNMGAVKEIPNATLLAAKAGCDIILMPPNEVETLHAIIAEMKGDTDFMNQVEASVRRIIRAKICLGMKFNAD